MYLKAGLISVFFVVFFYGFPCFSQDKNNHGLYFNSYPQQKEKRTSLELSDQSSFTTRRYFRIEFDLSFWGNKQFGYVFRMFDKNKHNIDLVFIPIEQTIPLLRVVVNGNPTSLVYQLKGNEVIRNNWMKVGVTLDMEKSEILFKIGNTGQKEKISEISQFKKFDIVFGALNSGNLATTDVPEMAIRNIKIYDNKRVIHSWLLNESGGNRAADLFGSYTARVVNPTWLINKHYTWKYLGSQTLNQSYGIVYDSVSNNIILAGKNKIISFNTLTSEFSENIIDGACNDTSIPFSYFYSHKMKSIIAFDFAKKNITAYNEFDNKWTPIGKHTIPSRFNNATFYYTDSDTSLISVGGYQKFRYFNNIVEFNFRDKSWTDINYSGDKLISRYLTSITETDKPGEFIFFGGYGNESGEQELGPKCLFDAYLFNKNKHTLKKLFDIENKPEDFLPLSSFMLKSSKTELYVLGLLPFMNDTYLKLYRISLQSPSVSISSSSIHLSFDELKTKASLFYSPKTRELFAVVKSPDSENKSQFQFYSLSFPPVSKSFVTVSYNATLGDQGSLPQYLLYIIAAIGLLLLPALIFLLKKLLFSKGVVENVPGKHGEFQFDGNRADKKVLSFKLPVQNAVYILGEFKIFDQQGVEISEKISNKLKQLFLSLILFGTDEKGISNEKLTSIHWKYYSQKSARNNRNVNIKKLRDIFSGISGIKIESVLNHWILTIEKNVFCDYFYILHKIKQNYHPENLDELKTFEEILNPAPFEYAGDLTWVDSLRSYFISSLSEYLMQMVNTYRNTETHDGVIKACNIILNFDPLNEEVLRIKIETLIGIKKINQAYNEYHAFSKEYEKMYGTKNPVQIKFPH